MARRIVLLGTTGVEKAAVVARLLEYLDEESETGRPQVASVDFEKDFILEPHSLPHYDYLDEREETQRLRWADGWKSFEAALQRSEYAGRDIILRIHGVLVRPLYGVRSPAILPWIIDAFKPTHIFTLIDDIYSMWFRTERRAEAIRSNGTPTEQGHTYIGRPSLEELLGARRAELFFGDILARHCSAVSKVRNVVLAVRHPARVLSRLIFSPPPVKPVYLSFPITGPRELFEDTHGQDRSGFHEVNAFLKHAIKFERKNRGLVFFCPLTIDEKPLARSLQSVNSAARYVRFQLDWRWNVQEFYGVDEKLLCDATKLPAAMDLRQDEVRAAIGCVDADVATRDYRLVMQSRCLAVFNPWFRDKEGGGVLNEIACAGLHHIPTRIYQDPKHDPSGNARATLQRSAGSLGLPPGAEYVKFYDTIEDLFESLLNL